MGPFPRLLLLAPAITAALIGCSATDDAVNTGWTRAFPAARFVTAPVAVGDDVVVAVTTVDTGAVLDEHGAAIGLVAGNARRATCTVLRLGDDGAPRWSLPVIARGGQTLCTSVEAVTTPALAILGAIAVRGEAFDINDDEADGARVEAGGRSAVVDEGFVLTLDDDGLARSLSATPPPLLRFAEGGVELDVAGRTLRAPSTSGYLQQSGAVSVTGDDTIVSLLVPQGTELSPLLEGAVNAPHLNGVQKAEESVVVLARLNN